MWRSTKSQVSDELGLPPQDERFSWLRFSPVEAHFYRQQHERCAVKAREVIANYRKQEASSRPSSGRGLEARKELDTSADQNGDVGSKAPSPELEDRLLSNKEAEKLLDQLRCLRQACVHPQVGSAGIRALQKLPMTMDEILEVQKILILFLLLSLIIELPLLIPVLTSANDMLSSGLGSEGAGRSQGFVCMMTLTRTLKKFIYRNSSVF